MKMPTEKRLKELDEINLLRLLKFLSLGNLLRGFYYLLGKAEPVSSCVENCAKTQAAEIEKCLEDIKKDAGDKEEEESDEEEPENAQADADKS